MGQGRAVRKALGVARSVSVSLALQAGDSCPCSLSCLKGRALLHWRARSGVLGGAGDVGEVGQGRAGQVRLGGGGIGCAAPSEDPVCRARRGVLVMVVGLLLPGFLGGRLALVFPAVVGGPGERVAVGVVVGRRRSRLCSWRGRASSPTSRSWPGVVCVGARACGLCVGGRVCPVLRAPAAGRGCPTHRRWCSMWVG